MGHYRRSPRSLGSALDGLQCRLAPPTLLAEVQRHWRSAVGEAISREATPLSERLGVVTVACSASVWAQELDLMAPLILARLNELLSAGTVTRLRCTTT